MIKLSAFADEANSLLSGQIAALKRNKIEYVELRGINGQNIADVSCEQAEIYARELIEAGIKVWSIGSPIGKVKLSDDLDAHVEKCRHVCRLANIFGAERVRMFSFYEAYGDKEKVFSTLRRMVAVGNEYGVKMCHENEKAIYGDTLERVLEILDNVKGLYSVYDPANFIEVGEDPEATLSALHGVTEYFHIKDVIANTGEIVPAGYGNGMISELVARMPDGADTVLTLEPHLAIFDGYAQIDATEMKNKFHFSSNEEAFDAAVTALKQVLAEQGYKEVNGGFEK